jgi:hypothetical protein
MARRGKELKDASLLLWPHKKKKESFLTTQPERVFESV